MAPLLTAAYASAPPGSKRFHDPETDVSFVYPATWKLGNSLSDYIPSAILSNEMGAAIATVGYQGIPRSDLTEVEFVYAFTLTPDEKGCDALGQTGSQSDEDEKRSGWVTINGARYWHTPGGDAGLSHWATQNTYAAFRNGRCMLFEEGIHGLAQGVEERTVSKARLAAIGRELHSVMQSVVIGTDYVSMLKYEDPKEPVSFLYPNDWVADPGMGFFQEPLILGAGDPAGRLVPGMIVGFNRQNRGDFPEAWKDTTLDGIEFVYAALPKTRSNACDTLLRKDAGAPGAEVEIGSMQYLHASVPGVAATGHEAWFEMYATDPDNETCFLFEYSVHIRHGDETARAVTDAGRAGLERKLQRVMESVVIDWTHPKP